MASSDSAIDELFSQVVFAPPSKSESSIQMDYIDSCSSTKEPKEKIAYKVIGKPRPSSYLMIFVNGNAMTVEGSMDLLYRLLQKSKGVRSIVGFGYRGYGESDGSPSLEKGNGVVEDLKTIVDHFSRAYPKIILWGHSIGTGIVASYLATYQPEWSHPVILSAPYTSMLDVPMWSFLKNHLVEGEHTVHRGPHDRMITIDNLKFLKCPIRVFHGMEDRIIPATHSAELAKVIDQVEPVFLEGAGHNDLFGYIFRYCKKYMSF